MTRSTLAHLACRVALIVAAVPAPASAQHIAAPPRSEVEAPSATGRGQAAPTTSRLVLDASLTSGYDSNEVAAITGQVGGDVFTDGYNAFGDMGLAYSRTQGETNFDARGRGYVNGYPGSDIEPGFGTNVTVGGGTAIGRSRVSANVDARYEPYFSLGAFSAAPTSTDAPASPETSPTSGLVVDQHSWISTGLTEFSRQWTRRHLTDASFTFQRSDRGATGNDVTSQWVQLDHMISVGRSGRVGGGYTYSRSDLSDGDESLSTGNFDTQGLEFRASLDRRLSRTRRIELSGAVGALQVQVRSSDTGEVHSWVPSGEGGLRVDIGRAWALVADYRHGVSTLGGVSQEAFSSDVVTFGAGGPLGSRTSLAVSSGWSSGGAEPVGGEGSYTTYSLSTQLGLILARCCSAVVNYTLYDYRFSDVPDAPETIPTDFARGALRVGMTVSVPLLRPARPTPPRPTPPRQPRS